MADPPAPPPKSERLVAIDKIRDTARWLILAFAAIGAALAGTAPLSNLGKLDFWSLRFLAAVLAAVIGLAGVAAAIAAVSRVFAPLTVDLASLVKDSALARLVESNPTVLQDHGHSLEEFYGKYQQAHDEHRRALERVRLHPKDTHAKHELKLAEDRIHELRPVEDWLTEQGLLVQTRRTYGKARKWIFVGGISAGIALVGFTWAANPPEARPAQAATKAKATPAAVGKVTAAPVGAGVTISPHDATALATSMGMKPAEAEDVVGSFRGPIEIETVAKGAPFFRYASRPKGSGRFLTRTRFLAPALARLGLHLPYANTAECLQRVVAKRRVIVLEGEINAGRPKIRQIFVLVPKAFAFGRGRSWGDSRCPRK